MTPEAAESVPPARSEHFASASRPSTAPSERPWPSTAEIRWRFQQEIEESGVPCSFSHFVEVPSNPPASFSSRCRFFVYDLCTFESFPVEVSVGASGEETVSGYLSSRTAGMLAVRRDEGPMVRIHDVLGLLRFLQEERAAGVGAEILAELLRRLDGSHPWSDRIGALFRGLGLRTYERPRLHVEEVAQGLRVSGPDRRAILVQVDPRGCVTSWSQE